MTVLFADVTGSAGLGERLDPERLREVMEAYFQAMREEIEAEGGTVEKFIGDAVMAAFGVPAAHEDDAARALRAAARMQARLEEVNRRLEQSHDVTLRIRIAVNTGEVLAATAPHPGEAMVTGDAVNVAARLQQAAEPGTVLAGETTWLLTKDHVQYGERLEVEAKGFEETLPAWPVIALAPRSSRRTIPFVDRRRELRLLVETFERAQEARRGHMVTLLGEPGIGKSRVVEEFLAGLSDTTKVLAGRASPFEEDVTFAPVAQILLQEIGEPADAPPEQLEASLETLVQNCCPTERTQEIVDLLRLALGLGDESRDRRRYRVAEIRSGLLALLQGLATRGPVVMVVEDAHLAQPPLLDLVEQMVRAVRRPLRPARGATGLGRRPGRFAQPPPGGHVAVGCHRAGQGGRRGAGRGLGRAYRPPRGGEPLLHRGDHGDAHALERRGGLGHRAASPRPASSDGAGHHRGPHRPLARGSS